MHARIDFSTFIVRFVFGAIPGALLGFGFWVQMCRPARTLGLLEHIPRLVVKWFDLADRVDSGQTGMMVIVVFASVSGILVAAWPFISKRFAAI